MMKMILNDDFKQITIQHTNHTMEYFTSLNCFENDQTYHKTDKNYTQKPIILLKKNYE